MPGRHCTRGRRERMNSRAGVPSIDDLQTNKLARPKRPDAAPVRIIMAFLIHALTPPKITSPLWPTHGPLADGRSDVAGRFPTRRARRCWQEQRYPSDRHHRFACELCNGNGRDPKLRPIMMNPTQPRVPMRHHPSPALLASTHV
jgi:hypothetical protein